MRPSCLALLFALAVGCGARSTRIEDDGPGTDGDTDVDADTDVDPCAYPHSADVTSDTAGHQVDLLVVIDDSRGMREEQANLTANLPMLVDMLVDPPDEDRNGVGDHPAPSTLHIGVVSTDMGTGGYPVATCDDAERGDDGVLQNVPFGFHPGCDARYPRFLTFDVERPDPNIDHDFACIATMGTSGCTFEQPLRAVEKALTVHSAPGAVNCADPGRGDCFLRDGSLLAILLVTDSDDCSVSDPRIFGDDDALGPMNLRCFDNPDMLRPVDGLVASILGIKPGRPERVVVSGIVGVPQDLVFLSRERLRSDDLMTTDDFDEILADPRMLEAVDYSPEGGGNRLVPSCDVPGLGIAFPPRRIVELVRAIDLEGGDGLVQSICQADWVPAMVPVARAVLRAREVACLRHPLRDPSGPLLQTEEHADCVVRETLADDGPCGPGRLTVGTHAGRTVCHVCQLGDGEGENALDFRGRSLRECAGTIDYWWYSTEDEVCGSRGKVEFTHRATPAEDSLVRIHCADETLPPPPDC